MPDASGHERHSLPPRWGDAFAALPLEAAPPQAWERLRGRMPAPSARTRRRWPLWLAAAASLATVGMLSLPGWRSPDAVGRHASASASPPASTALPPPSGAAFDPPARAAPIAQAAPERMPPAPRSPVNREPPSASAIALIEHPHADTEAATEARPGRVTAARASAESSLAPLYAESAQLEALLAAARDDRIASSAAAALTDSLDAELAMIDANLIQPDLDAMRRAGLWQRRVDTLRQLAGIETTRRLLSARGETYDAALVSID